MNVRIIYCETWGTNATLAASFAGLIRDQLGAPVELEKGRMGQFEILVDGKTVVSRKGGLVAKILRRPWPTADDVVFAVRAALPKR